MPKYKWSTKFMSDYDYRTNLNAQEARKRRVRTFLTAFFITIILAAGGVIYDALRTKTIITTGKPTTATLGESSKQQVFDTLAFRFKTDLGWQKLESIPTNYRSYNPYRYHYRDADGKVRRELYIFQDNIPEGEGLNYVLPVEILDNRIEPLGELSPLCNTLLNDPLETEKVPVEWGGVNFTCLTQGHFYRVGAVHNKMGYGLQLAGTNAVHRYFFLYQDVSDSPSYDVFVNILRSFETK